MIRKYRVLRIAVAMLLLGAACLVLWLWSEWGTALTGADQLRISRETTFLTEPLDAEGNVDYIGAINAKYGEGISPENNAVVLLWQAFGPENIPGELRAEYFALLGCEEPPAEGDYYTLDLNLSPKDGEADEGELLTELIRQPWRREQHPEVHEWLEKNEAAMEHLAAASRRPDFFAPIVSKDGAVYSSRLPQDWWHWLLCCRAMRHLGEGNGESAWNDLLAQSRLNRLYYRQFDYISFLTACSMESATNEAVCALLHEGNWTADQLRRLQAEWDALPENRPLRDMLAFEWRMESLLAGTMSMKSSREVSGNLAEEGGTDSIRGWVVRHAVDWNRIFTRINLLHDELDAINEMENGDQRNTKFEEFRNRYGLPKKQTTTIEVPPTLRRRARENQMMEFISDSATGIIDGMNLSEKQLVMHREMMQLAFALELYRAKNGAYPDRLEQLAPAHATAIPLDRFNGQSLQYRSTGGDYQLHSVGINGIDDGGLLYRDLVIRTPGWKTEENEGNKP